MSSEKDREISYLLPPQAKQTHRNGEECHLLPIAHRLEQ